MVLAKPQPPILDDGKHWEADKLGRKKVANFLTARIESIKQPFVISLASDYGTGKTFFIKCWRKDIEAKRIPCVYFNAWETDFSQDPLFAFISAIKKELAPLLGADSKFNEAVKKAGGIALKKVLPLGLKAILRMILGSDGAKEAFDVTRLNNEDIIKAAGEFAAEKLRSQQSAEDSISDFKNYLETAITEIVDRNASEHKKIVVFVDDLDRCRPDYAISVLECIKHLFSVQGLVFVLSVDNNQLHQAVKSVYGPAIDSDGYLRRFIDWQFLLPKAKTKDFVQFLVDKFHLVGLKNFVSGSRWPGAENHYAGEYPSKDLKLFAALSHSFGLSFRQIEQAFTDIFLVLNTIPENEDVFLETIEAVAVLKVAAPNVLEKSLSNFEHLPELANLLLDNLPMDFSLDLRHLLRFHREEFAPHLNLQTDFQDRNNFSQDVILSWFFHRDKDVDKFAFDASGKLRLLGPNEDTVSLPGLDRINRLKKIVKKESDETPRVYRLKKSPMMLSFDRLYCLGLLEGYEADFQAYYL